MIEGTLWKILAFLLAVSLMFVAPMMVIYDRQEAITYTLALSAVNEMTALSRELGFVNQNQYHQLMDRLGATGLTYDISLEHYKKVYIPVYDTLGTFTGDSYVSFEGVYNGDITDVIEGAGQYKMSTGDMFFLQVENRTPTPAQALRQMVWHRSSDARAIIVRSGGMVHNEPD